MERCECQMAFTSICRIMAIHEGGAKQTKTEN